MYPGMAKQARDEGFGEIADWFETLAKAERSHANRFQKALDAPVRLEAMKEGSLEAPTRHPLDWKNPEFWDQAKAEKELERIFDICHGCRRCVSLCTRFRRCSTWSMPPPTMEVDGVEKEDYWKVVDQCYLCDLCYMTKCPYVPPHPWNVDFPHVMLRAKAIKFKKQASSSATGCSPPPTRWASSPRFPWWRRRSTPSTAIGLREAFCKPRSACTRTASCRPTRRASSEARAAKSKDFPGARRQEHAGQGGDLRHLLRELQRAGHGPRPARDPRSTTRSRT